MFVIGMISGTSVDGVDAVIIDIAGQPIMGDGLQLSLLQQVHVPYTATLREEILAGCRPESSSVDRLCALNFAIGEAFADAARRAIEAASLTPQAIDLIGSHGQTVWHIPPTNSAPGSTLQLGESAVIAERTGITTISNFRTRDMAAGGHGAPLVSYVDWLLFSHPTEVRALQNVGGIANVTFLPPRSQPATDVFAFDTGPGNMLIDYVAGQATHGAWSYDRDGQLAAAGQVNPDLLAELMAHPYLAQQPPKTTGREVFGVHMGEAIWQKGKARRLSETDIVATITAFTGASIARAYRDFLPGVMEVIVSGGGARNPVLMGLLRERLAPARVTPIDAHGILSETKEAVAFAVLAYETWHGRPGTLPTCTGASHATLLGDITPGLNYQALVRQANSEQ